MEYFKSEFHPPVGSGEVLIAFLGDVGFEMFEELDDKVIAYIPSSGRTESDVEALIRELPGEFTGTGWKVERMADRNWNEEWEKSFQPVLIDEKVLIRAPFHPAVTGTGILELVIEPKMSFGTGHHATTSLMVKGMLSADFSGKKVLDMGCGSGVLAILAEKLGAFKVDAVDIDDWAVDNSLENIRANDCSSISVWKGNASSLVDGDYDIILANINRNILLLDMPVYASRLRTGGLLFLSGFLKEDISHLESSASSNGMRLSKVFDRDNWSMLVFEK